MFPGHLWIDSVRVYQKGKANVGCNPKDYRSFLSFSFFFSSYLLTYLDV